MNILKVTTLAALLSVFLLVGLSYALPSCCDPNSNAGVASNSFPARSSSGQYAPLKPLPYGALPYAKANPGFRQAPVASRVVRPAASGLPSCCDPAAAGPQTASAPLPSCCSGSNPLTNRRTRAYVGQGQAPVRPIPSGNVSTKFKQASVASRPVKPAASGLPSCCDSPTAKPQTASASLPSCCSVGNTPTYGKAGAYVSRLQESVKPIPLGNLNTKFKQASVASTPVKPAASGLPPCCDSPTAKPQTASASLPSCCSSPNTTAYRRVGTYVGRVQAPVGSCGGGCGGGCTVSATFPGYQTARPIGQFTRTQPSGAKVTPAVYQGNFAPKSQPYRGQGFGRPGYFGQVAPISTTLY
jgi:hypothetical protein